VTATSSIGRKADGSLDPPASAGPSPRSKHGPISKRQRVGAGLVAPSFLFVIVFVLFPLAYAVYISLTNWPLVGSYHFVGLQNYASLGSNAVFLHSVLFTLLYTAIVTPAIFVLGYAMAMFVRRNRPGSTLFRTLFFLPYIVGLATESYMVVLDVQPRFGIVNVILSNLGLASINTAWLIHTGLALAVTCVLVTWYAAGLTMLLLVGGMQGVSTDVYEAASMDGASWWQRESHITLPLLRPTIALSLIISVIGSFLAFNQFYILTQGGPGTSTETIVMWIYQVAFVQLHLGAATAMAIVLVIAVGLVSLVQFIMLRDPTKT